MTEQELMKLSNAALQDELKKQNQSTNGNKTVISTKERQDNVEELLGFPSTAMWRVFTARQEPVPEPQMGGQLRATTVPEGETSIPNFDFKETFNREPFTEMSEVFKSENGKLCKDRRGRQIMESVVRNEGRANAAWLEKITLPCSVVLKNGLKLFYQTKGSQQTQSMFLLLLTSAPTLTPRLFRQMRGKKWSLPRI